jgi:hypothetical protein
VVEISRDAKEADIKSYLADALESLGLAVGPRSLAQLQFQLQACVVAKKVLYILDNAQTYQQLNALLPAKWGKGSVVIVTSRLKPSEFTSSEGWQQVMLA